jgi:tetratricopeptide (TPR) repeat protein
MAEGVRHVRVFVSSPGDVAPERGRVEAVATKLNQEYEDFAAFETILWEESFYKADRTFQVQIPEAAACDIVVSIFWTKIGTELPPQFMRMPDGRPYPSGTAYELLTALEASRKQGVPDVYVFRKTADTVLPTTDAQRRRQAQTHLDALEAFWSEWFVSEKGEFKAAFHSFANTDAFEQQLEELLRQWLQSRGLLGPRLTWPKEKGSPFRGLAPFEAEHARVFFGRDRVIDEARRRLAGAAERGTPLLFIVGASGCGKSSLARAGVIPRLTTPGMVVSIDVWRVAIMKPSEGREGPLRALAMALLADDALPELGQGDFPDAAMLADHFERGGGAAAQPVLRALERAVTAAQEARHAERSLRPMLVLLIDQFEELFAKGVNNVHRVAFAETLKQLVATRGIWVVATLRADLYELVIREPTLKALKEAGASLDLGLPGPAELADIVRAPAQAAGLTFENDPAKGTLDERLLADAKTADSLPLLEFTLQQLYERRVETKDGARLTHDAYDALGGLEGAIAAEAERAVSSLNPKAVATLPRLLRRLAEPAQDGQTLTLREGLRSEAEADASEAALVDALTAARILITGTDGKRRPTVRLAHDAVFVSWPRAKDAANANREFYRVRAEVEDGLRLWQQHGRRKDRLIQPGVPLAEAEDLVRNFANELPAELTAYVAASRHRARLRQQGAAAAALFFFVLAAVATWAGTRAYLAQQEALVERDRTAQALKAVTDTGNDLMADFAQEFFVRLLPTDLFGRMLDRAIQGNDRAIQLDPKFSAAYIGRGLAYGAKGDYNRAVQDYDKAILLDPKNAVAYQNRGAVYGSKGDYDRAIQDYDQAIQLDPKSAFAYVGRGAAYGTRGNRERSIQDYDKAILLDPKNAAYYIARGGGYASEGDHDRAIQDYGQAILLDPKSAVSHATRGDAYASKREHDRAIQDYDQAIRLDPKNPEVYRKRGAAYASKGDHDRAIQDYDKVILLDPQNALAYVNRGVAYAARSLLNETKGDQDRAIQDYDEAIRLDPKNALAHASRGLAYGAKGDYNRAIRDCDQAILLDPKNAVAYQSRGAVYGSKGDYDRAIQDHDQAIQLDPKFSGAYLSRGLDYGAKRDYDRAIQDYEKAILLDPKNPLPYYSRGEAYRSKGEYDQAIQNYDQAILLNPTNANAYANRGLAYGIKGDHDRAIQDYDQAILLDPKNANAHSERGRTHFYQGNFKAAAVALLRANELEDNSYSMIWRYLAREYAGENGAAELKANAARLKSKEWPYPVIELYLGQRSPAEILSVAKPEDRCEAQFYSGEWHLLHGNRTAATTALQAAADSCSHEFFEYAGALAELKRLNLQHQQSRQ